MKKIFILIVFLILAAGLVWADDGKALYMKYCASCHHAERYGVRAPALIPETLKGYKKDGLIRTIKDGLPATQMPSFKRFLTDDDIEKVVSHITSPVNDVKWGSEDIAKSRKIFGDSEINGSYGLTNEYRLKETKSTGSISNLDYENITLIVESGKGVTVMDGGSFKILDRFETGAIHGGPKFSYSLRHVYAPTRDGVITKYDLSAFKKVGSIKAGVNTRNIAVSDDDRWIAVANNLPDDIVFLDEDLNLNKTIDIKGRVGGIYTLARDKRFVCSFRDLPELWLVDYAKGFEVEKLTVPEPFEDVSISPLEDVIIGASRKGTRIYIYSIREKKVISSFETDGMPHLSSATYWIDKGILYTAINHLKRPVMTIMDLNDLKIVKEINLAGSGFFVRTHQDTPYIWADTNTDTVQLIDKKSLEVVKTLVPLKGKKAMHIEFTKDGRYAMVSVYEDDGELVIYDAFKLDEIMRLPFKKPAGKYNALNKTYPKIQATGYRQQALGK